MARKKQETVKPEPHLTAEEYWQWRTTIAEMKCANEKLRSAGLQAQVMRSSVELSQCKLSLHLATIVRNARDESEAGKTEYHNFKRTLEDRLGVSLNGKLIDDITFEVKDLPNDNNDIGEK